MPLHHHHYYGPPPDHQPRTLEHDHEYENARHLTPELGDQMVYWDHDGTECGELGEEEKGAKRVDPLGNPADPPTLYIPEEIPEYDRDGKIGDRIAWRKASLHEIRQVAENLPANPKPGVRPGHSIHEKTCPRSDPNPLVDPPCECRRTG